MTMHINEKYPYGTKSIIEEWNPENIKSEIETITDYRNKLNQYLIELEEGLKVIKPVKWSYVYSIDSYDRYALNYADIAELKTLPGYQSDSNHIQGFIFDDYMTKKSEEFNDLNDKIEFRLYKNNEIKLVKLTVYKYPKNINQYTPQYFQSGKYSHDRSVWNYKDTTIETICIPGITRLDKSGNENQILYEVIERLKTKYPDIIDLKTI